MNITEESYNKLLAENMALKEGIGQILIHSSPSKTDENYYKIRKEIWNNIMDRLHKIPETNYHETRIRNAEYVLGALETYKEVADSLVKTLKELDNNV